MDQKPQNQPVAGPAAQPAAAPQPPKSNAAPVVIGLVVVGAIVLLGIIAAIAVVILNAGPSKKDYTAAYNTMNQIRTSYNDTSNGLQTIGESSSSSSRTKSNLNESFDRYKSNVEKLSKLKALKDKDVKKAYDAFTARNEKFVGYLDGIIGSVDSISAVGEKCDSSALSSDFSGASSDPDQVLATYKTAVAPCKAALEKLQSSKNTMIAQYGKDSTSELAAMEKNLEDMVAGVKASNQSAVYSAESDLDSNAEKLYDTASTFQSDIEKDAEKYEVKDQLNALGEIVTDKVNHRG